MNIDQLLERLGFSNRHADDKQHCAALYRLALSAMRQSGEVVELAGHQGVSGACIALACQERNRKLVAYDLCNEISNEVRKELWRKVGVLDVIEARKGTCEDVLKSGCQPCFIFHGADQGEHVFPEYEALWSILKPGGTLCIHDAERIAKYKWGKLVGADNYVFHTYGQDRVLAVFFKRSKPENSNHQTSTQ